MQQKLAERQPSGQVRFHKQPEQAPSGAARRIIKLRQGMRVLRRMLPVCLAPGPPSVECGISRPGGGCSSLEQVQAGLRKAGLESSNLILGIDFTKSNLWTGAKSFGGRCLHETATGSLNPYQHVIQVVGRTLQAFDDDGLIPSYGFGDMVTKDKGCFPLYPDKRPCRGFEDVLSRYCHIAPGIELGGPTNFAPVIHTAIESVREHQAYHILIIIADGQVSNLKATEAAIVEASNYALSIVVVGVGDGPWDKMEEFDDGLPERAFDNFHFVPFDQTMRVAQSKGLDVDAAFAAAALAEIPEQYRLVKELRYL